MASTVSRLAADGKDLIMKDNPQISVRSQWGEFAIVPVEILESDLSPRAVLVFIALMSRVDHRRNGEAVCWPSYEAIRERSAVKGREAISAALDELESKGYLRRERRFSASTVYTLLRPPVGGNSSESERMSSDAVVRNPNDISSESERQKFGIRTLTRITKPDSIEQEPVPARGKRGASAPSLSPESPSRRTKKSAATPTPEQPATQSIPDAPACEEPVRPERAPKSPLYGDCFVAVGKACVMDAKAPMSAKRISIAAKYLAQRGIDPAAVAGFAAWWSANDWRGKRGDKPTPERITELWVQYEEAQHSPKPATTTANVGGNANNNGKFRRAQVTFTDEQRRAIEEQARRALEEETNS